MGVPLVGGSANPVYLVDGNGNTVSSPNNSTVTPAPGAVFVVNDPGLPDTPGQKTAANSTSVVLASDQGTISVKTEASTPGAAVAVNVTTSAVQIKAASTRKRITITNDSANILYIGTTSGVTATNASTKGLAIAANGGGITVAWQTDIYGIYATGSNFVSYIEET